ncbi:MAG: tetratricopeptide repeat protein, partial [Planctomycetes bacterium]|nr:tetratricopeptide repeat protein [Planctomycetota bacterium]
MIRALIRDRRFTDAVRHSDDAVERAVAERGEAAVEVLAAQASALYRVQRNDEAAQIYRRVLEVDPLHEEAHIRLGSGLTAPRSFAPAAGLRLGIAALRAGRLDEALDAFRGELEREPGNPVAHRLVGETLFLLRSRAALVHRSSAFASVQRLAVVGAVDEELAREFMPQIDELAGSRRDVALRTLALFHRYLGPLVAKGARHDLLLEDQRTTDDPARAALRGKRTFDGRVWDDVRGVGGLRAATGIEALDEAAAFGFDTLAHEVAHQVHLHVLRESPAFARIKVLHRRAVDEGRVLDYYAASNWAEYFGQGVEAFVSLCKRPASEATHGHTRF